VQHPSGLHRLLEALDVTEREVDAWRDDQALVRDVAAAREPHGFLRRIDRGNLVAHHPDAVAREAVDAARDVLHARKPGEDQVRNRARDEARIALDEHDVD
jgi:hypothetical protein